MQVNSLDGTTTSASANGPVDPVPGLVDELSRIIQLARARGSIGSPNRARLPVRILFKLDYHGAQRATVLAAACGVDLSVVSRAVDALAKEGLVERVIDPGDRRASLVTPTPAGTAEVAEIRRRQNAATRAALAAWTDLEIATTRDMLSAIADAWPEGRVE